MRGDVPPLPNTTSWRGAQLKKHRDNFTLPLPYFKSIILPIVLYGCETWSLTLREEHKLRGEYLDLRGRDSNRKPERNTK
jgi:hypothetical protein